MIMTQQEFIQSVPWYSFGLSIIDNQTGEEKFIGHATNDIDEIIYEFGDMVEEIDAIKRSRLCK
jgi:hypothetical protein